MKEEYFKKQDRILRRLYGTLPGRLVLKPLTSRWFSQALGRIMDSRISLIYARKCIRAWDIDLDDFLDKDFANYNEFFVRRIRPQLRPIPEDKECIISPCDGLACCYEIDERNRFSIKGRTYSLEELFQDSSLEEKYMGGICVLIRLNVANCHRYCYAVSGTKNENKYIKGRFHTVNPIAYDYYPIYKENAREYTTISSPKYGDVIQMEVGALGVGKIVNHLGAGQAILGQEKGYFEYGGSTITLFIPKGNYLINDRLKETMSFEEPMEIKMGQVIC